MDHGAAVTILEAGLRPRRAWAAGLTGTVRARRGPARAAVLTTALTGAQNDLVYTAQEPGVAGAAITVAYLVAGTNTPLTVAVLDRAITVHVATNGAGAATSTAAQVRAAVAAHPRAAQLVGVGLAADNDGTGVVAALTATPLARPTPVAEPRSVRVRIARIAGRYVTFTLPVAQVEVPA